MKSLMTIFRHVLIDMGTLCGISTNRDLMTATVRGEDEGISFFTISLANFGADFQKSLDQGFVDHDQFAGFRRSGSLPRFLGGFFDLIFSRASGRLLETPSVDAIYAVRQLTLAWAKIALPCTPKRERLALTKYLETEQEIRQFDNTFVSNSGVYLDPAIRFQRMASKLWAGFLTEVDTRIHLGEIIPKHGPGATADRLKGNLKYVNRTWTDRLENVFPAGENILPSFRFVDELWSVIHRSPGMEMPVRVITVPKTQKTPRIIAIEPASMQFMQQGLLEAMRDAIPRHDNAENFIRFDDQRINNRLARVGSVTGQLATLDLSEASDRVSNQHVRALVAPYSGLRAAVDATRSRKADVNGQVIRLAKYASMGSALTFPMEAMVFTTVIFLGIERQLNRPLTVADFKSYYGLVRVYGDDIVVPVDYVQSVVRELEAFGFRVNHSKSFWTGKFRESCGKEFYDGHDISIVRLRRFFPDTLQCVEEWESLISFRNQLYQAGLWTTVKYVDNWIEEQRVPFPIVEATSPLLGRHSVFPVSGEAWDNDLHLPLVKGMVVKYTLPKSQIDSSAALLKFFLKRGTDPVVNEDHLERAGRPCSARIVNRWAHPF